MSGPAIKPIALANVHKIYKSVNIPIIGLGGIKSVNDILEFILAGADLIQIGTLNYKEPGIGVRLASELQDYLKQNNISSVSELKGQLNINDIIIEAKRTPITKSSDLKNVVDKIIKQGDKNLLLSIIDSNNRRRYIGIKLN